MLDAIPFEYVSPQAPLIAVEGRLGPKDKRSRIVVDTGATAPFAVFLSPEKARALGLSLSEEITPGATTAIGGGPQTYRTGTLPSVAIGPVRLAQTPVAVVPMIDEMSRQAGQPIGGIIGYQFLRNQRVSIDYGKRRIDLAAPTIGAGGTPFALAARKPIILVETMVNGTGPFVFEIDTGATITSLSPETAQKAHVAATGEGTLGGAGGSVAVKRGDAQIKVGDIAFDLRNVTVTDSLAGISQAAGSPVDGILGLDYFYRTKLTIDYPASTVWIVKAD